MLLCKGQVLEGHVEALERRERLGAAAGRPEQAGVIEQRRSGHDAVGACVLQQPLRIGEALHVAVAYHGDVEVALDGADGVPVGAHLACVLLVARAAVHGEERCAGALDHACIPQRVLELREDADLRADRSRGLLQR